MVWIYPWCFVKVTVLLKKSIGTEKVLVPLTDNVADMNKVFNLNELGAFVFDAIDGQKSLADVLGALLNEYEVSQEVAEKDMEHFITVMVNKGVLFTKQH